MNDIVLAFAAGTVAVGAEETSADFAVAEAVVVLPAPLLEPELHRRASASQRKEIPNEIVLEYEVLPWC